MSATPILLAAPGLAQEAELVALLGQRGASLTITRRCVDALDLMAAAGEGVARVAVVSARLPRLTRDTIGRLAALGITVVGLAASDADADATVLRNLDIPLVTMAPPDESGRDDLNVTVAALARLVVDPRPSSLEYSGGRSPQAVREIVKAPGRLVAVWGPVGAPGRTTVAVGLADEWARNRTPALLVDADTVGGGAVAAHLGVLDEVSGIVVACRHADTGRLDPPALAAAARTVHGDLRVLTGIPRAERWAELRPAALTRLWQAGRNTSGVMVVDAGFSLERDEEIVSDARVPRRAAATLTALAAADMIVAVGSADPVGMERLVHALGDLRRAFPETPVRVIVNRVRRSALGPDATGQIRETLRRHVGIGDAVCVPEDREACDAALRAGGTLAEVAPRSQVRNALRELVTEWTWPAPLDIAA